MKKFVAIVLTLSLFLAIGAVASTAEDPAWDSATDWGVSVVINKETKAVTFTLDSDKIGAAIASTHSAGSASATWVEMYISEEPLDLSDATSVQQGSLLPSELRIIKGEGDSINYVAERTINQGPNGEGTYDAYPFEEGTTYYVYFAAVDASLNGGAWVTNPRPTILSYSGNYPSTNADWGINAVV